ncbi:alkaline phosphatase family protein [Mucisphaera calidilacus]|uniref:Tetratricopeptide repeat protein n=1 Tax=Mucisphaera calidilacus TaxID=2527982 RepID=A0A518BU19_9BACT|nr:alkaline phosphatase family protein [Mucisphaera calidilacus]QDU70469.1 tetratricopeptide repeat protein [Mucisphaera calidilacus]
MRETPATRKRVLLIGWDAADWQMIDPLLQAGAMPNLEALIGRGVRGNLATIRPILSPMLWTSIATGKRADKHGICGFTEPKPDGTGIRPVTSTSRATKAVWNILSQKGYTSAVCSWFASHPAEPIKGSVVTDQFARLLAVLDHDIDPGPGTFHPPELAEQLNPYRVDPRMLDAQTLLPFVPAAAEIEQEQDGRLMTLAHLIAKASTIHAAGCHQLRETDWDFAAIYYDAIDHFGHQFMPYHPPAVSGISERDARIYGPVMEGCYRFHDMMLGALTKLAGPDTDILLISDHGFFNDQARLGTDATEDPEHWHRPFGVVVAAGPSFKQNETLYGATILDVTPTILSIFDLPLGADMDGRPWIEIFNEPVTPDRVFSWDKIEGESGYHPPNAEEDDPVASAEAVAQLVALGYIDDPGEDVTTAVRNTTRDLLTNRASALADSRRASLAIPIWQKLIEDNPDEDAFRLQLARTALVVGQLDLCTQQLEALKPEHADTPTILLLEAEVLLLRRQPEKALEKVHQANKAEPESVRILNALGRIYLRTNQHQQALEAFEHSLALEPESPVVHNGLAQAYNNLQQHQQAVEHALQSIGYAHQYPAAHLNLGIALAQSGREDAAIQALEVCLGMSPQNRIAHQWLAKLYARDNRNQDKAREHDLMGQTVLTRGNIQ